MSIEDKTLAQIARAWHDLRASLADQGVPNGDLNLTFRVTGRLDGDGPKAEIEIYHYHYSGLEVSKTIKGFEFEETRTEFLRVIDRGQRLLRLTHKKED